MKSKEYKELIEQRDALNDKIRPLALQRALAGLAKRKQKEARIKFLELELTVLVKQHPRNNHRLDDLLEEIIDLLEE